MRLAIDQRLSTGPAEDVENEAQFILKSPWKPKAFSRAGKRELITILPIEAEGEYAAPVSVESYSLPSLDNL